MALPNLPSIKEMQKFFLSQASKLAGEKRHVRKTKFLCQPIPIPINKVIKLSQSDKEN